MIFDISTFNLPNVIRLCTLCISFYFYLSAFTKSKLKPLATVLIMCAADIATLGIITLVAGYPVHLTLFIHIAIQLIIFTLLFEQKFLTKFLYYAICNVATLLYQFFIALIIGIALPEVSKLWASISENKIFLSNYLIQFVSPIFFSFVFNAVVRKISNENGSRKITKNSFFILLMPTTHILYTLILIYPLTEAEMNNPNLLSRAADIALMAVIFFCFVADFLIFNMVDNTEAVIDKNIQLEMENQKQIIEYNSIRKMEQDIENLHKIRHEIVNQNMTLSILLENGNIDEAKKLLDTQADAVDALSPTVYCSDKVLNAVITFEMQKAKNSGVALNCDVQTNSIINFDSSELCSLFTNLIDNAIEAAAACDTNKAVNLTCRPINKMYAVHIENTYAPNNTKENEFSKLFKTNKKDPANHGYGLKIVRQIIKKYNGKISVDTTPEWVQIQIFLSPTEKTTHS